MADEAAATAKQIQGIVQFKMSIAERALLLRFRSLCNEAGADIIHVELEITKEQVRIIKQQKLNTESFIVAAQL